MEKKFETNDPRLQLLDGLLYEVISPGYHVQRGYYSTDYVYHAPIHRRVAWDSARYWKAMREGPIFHS